MALTAGIDLDRCAQELIRVRGGIRPHGALIVVDPSTLEFLQASANAEELFGARFSASANLSDLCGSSFRAEVRSWIDAADALFLRTANVRGRSFQVLGHREHRDAMTSSA